VLILTHPQDVHPHGVQAHPDAPALPSLTRPADMAVGALKRFLLSTAVHRGPTVPEAAVCTDRDAADDLVARPDVVVKPNSRQGPDSFRPPAAAQAAGDAPDPTADHAALQSR
jgi:hypothetical protein